MTENVEKSPAKKAKVNRLGMILDDYKGSKSTLCQGCGHDAITSSIVKACYDLGIEPHNVAKMSGIGCSSKTPNYFLKQSHGFNSVHGRMAAIATGAHLANRNLVSLGVSGDGDTASIGLGNFLHMVRRNVPIIYIVENNGCYGLTKGQFSATADVGSVKKGGKERNDFTPVDICSLAVQMGCGFVGRSFSGDTKQVQALIKAATAHNGTAVLDIISPCVTFNNHEGSTKSVTFARKHEDPLHEIDYIPAFDQIEVEYDEGTTTQVTMHDGSMVTLKKLDHEYDPTDKIQALTLLQEAQTEQHFYTGLMYYNDESVPLADDLDIIDDTLATLPTERIVPTNDVFEEIMTSFK